MNAVNRFILYKILLYNVNECSESIHFVFCKHLDCVCIDEIHISVSWYENTIGVEPKRNSVHFVQLEKMFIQAPIQKYSETKFNNNRSHEK